MSREYKKIKYNREGTYGLLDEHVLYVKFNHSCDITTVYDDNFDIVACYSDTVDRGYGWAMTQIDEYTDKLEDVTQEERKKIDNSRVLATKQSEWISVKDRLPEEGTRVLTYTEGEIIEGYIGQYGWRYTWLNCHGCGCCGEDDDKTTHWMPLPDPPREK